MNLRLYPATSSRCRKRDNRKASVAIGKFLECACKAEARFPDFDTLS
jgi:hypothetical protein